ncbi:MAG: hypothetical protein IH945_11420 [Armatimonadetes bacterium]|nr:hypothetical protein [Armatimonadota bacterium]
MRHQVLAKRNRRRNRGALLIDVLIGMVILVFATLTLMSLIPVIQRGEMMSEDQSKAIQMVSRLVEHVQMLPADDLNVQTLTSLNLIDQGQAFPPYSFTHIPLDEGSMYSPAQVLQDANGTINVTPLPDGSARVDILLTYTSKSGKTEQIQTGTIVGSFR